MNSPLRLIAALAACFLLASCETLPRPGIALPKPQIRVVPAVLPPPPRPRLKLTKRNAKLLEVAARDLADDRLSAALRRLAAHAGKPPPEPVENQPALR